MFWRSWGDGQAKTMLLHCALAHSGVLGGLVKILERPCFGPDFLGHGKSPDAEVGRDYCDQCFDAVLAGLPERPIDLIGHSFGATIALRIALEHPDRVKHLVLIEPAFVVAGQDSEHYAEYMAKAGQVFANIEEGKVELAAQKFNAVWGGASWDKLPKPMQDELVRLIHLIPMQSSAVVDDAPGMLNPGRLEGLGLPVVLLEGTLSPPIVGATQGALDARLPNSQRVVIGGAGHMSPISHPVEVGTEIARFLSR